MSKLSKRSTVYFKLDIHQALRMHAASAHLSISELIDESVCLLMREDQVDLATKAVIASEPDVSYEELLNDHKSHGKICNSV